MSEYLGDERRLVSIFRSPRRDGMYLYVDRTSGLAQVPDTLREHFGVPQHAMDLLLSPTRRLARVDVLEVLLGIQTQGFFLQLPPVVDDEMRSMIALNDKLAASRR